MSKPEPLSDQERTDLVAYLDGELTGDAARAIEQRLSLDPHYRTEADTLKRTWDLLDFLPKADPSPSFTERTLSKLVPVTQNDSAAPTPASLSSALPRKRWNRVWIPIGWAACILLSVWGGYRGYQELVPREPGDQELVRDLRLIENKRFYDLVDDIEFLKQLDHPDLFGDDAGGS